MRRGRFIGLIIVKSLRAFFTFPQELFCISWVLRFWDGKDRVRDQTGAADDLQRDDFFGDRVYIKGRWISSFVLADCFSLPKGRFVLFAQ